MHHRGFVHDQHIHIERIGRVVAELACVGPRAQQRVQGARWPHAGDQRVQVEATVSRHLLLQSGQCVVDGLLESRRRLARGRSERHAQWAAVFVQCQQQRQQSGCGVGLARAGSARDDRQPRTQRHGAGHFLPIGVGSRFGIGHKETFQPATCRSFGHRQRFAGPLQQTLAHALFVACITTQVQKRRIGRAAQHQRLSLVRGMGVAQTSARRIALQSGLPIGPRGGQVCPQGLEALRALDRRCRPAQQRPGRLAKIDQWQAGVAAPFHLGEHGCGHQQRGTGLHIEPQQLRCQCAVDVAHQALPSPQVQPLQGLRSAQALGGQLAQPVHLRGGHSRHA